MKKVLVNKKNNFSQLRLLFPNIKLVSEDYHYEYGPIIYSLFDYDPGESCELFLLQSTAGCNLDSVSGLCSFLRQINYMQESKIVKLEKRPSFGTKYQVYNMYQEAINLRISNRSYLGAEQQEEALAEVLTQPPYFRILYAEQHGYSQTLSTLLNLTLSYFNPEGMTLQKRRKLSGLFQNFNQFKFKTEYQLTGDDTLDYVNFISYFL